MKRASFEKLTILGMFLFGGIETALANVYSFTTIDVPGSSGTGANGINSLGQIVGSFLDASGLVRGFVYSNGSLTTFDHLNDRYTSASGINDSGQIVGATGGGLLAGYLFSDGNFTTFTGPAATRLSFTCKQQEKCTNHRQTTILVDQCLSHRAITASNLRAHSRG